MKKQTIKRLSALVLALVLCASLMLPGFAKTEGSAQEDPKTEEVVWKITSLADECKLPFVYDEEVDYSWFLSGHTGNFFPDGFVGTPGYLYVRDYDTGEVDLLIDRPVSAIAVGGHEVYAILEDSTVAVASLEDGTMQDLCTIPDAKLHELYSVPGNLCFVYGNMVCIFDLESKELKEYQMRDTVAEYTPLTNLRFMWCDTNHNIYLHDIRTGADTEIDVWYFEYAVDNLLLYNNLEYLDYARKIGDELAAGTYQPSPSTTGAAPVEMRSATSEAAVQATPAAGQRLPLSEYPKGSFFTTTGGTCGPNHDHCKETYGGYQCEGFARYVYATYAHMQGFDYYSHLNTAHFDSGRVSTAMNSEPSLKAFLCSLPAGSYVRFVRKNAQSGTEMGVGGHAVVICGATNSGVTLYDANFDNRCGVDYRTADYAWFFQRYSRVYRCLAHNYGSAVPYSSAYHKVPCTYSGCNGYLLYQHYAATPGSNAKCLACGYVGSISVGINEVPDETE